MFFTQNKVPFEDNFESSDIQHKLLLIPKRKDKEDKRRYKDLDGKDKDKMYWNVIDTAIGVSYIAPFERASVIYEKHKESYPESKTAYKIKSRGIPKEYYYLACVIEEHLCIRFFKYHPTMNHPKGTLYELFRIVFYKNDAWEETREEKYPLVQANVFSKRSVIKRAKPLGENRLHTFEHKFDTAITPLGKEINTADVVFKIPNYQDCFHPIFVCRLFFEHNHIQHFNSNVPPEIIEHLMNDKPLLGYITVQFTGELNNNERAYIGKKHIFYFRQNLAGQWNSSCKKYCYNLYSATPKTLKIDGRKIRSIFKGTIYEGCHYDVKSWFGLLEYFDYQKKYLCVEQAVKIKRIDLANALIDAIQSDSKSYKSKIRTKVFPRDISFSTKTTLPEVMKITGAQLKFLPDSLGFVELKNYYKIIGNPILKKIFSIEELIRMSFLNEEYLSFIVEQYIDHSASPTPFVKALLKKPIDEQDKILVEYYDYLKRLYKPAVKYLSEHDNIDVKLKMFVSPSKVSEYHEKAVKISTAIHIEEETKRQKENNKKIAELNQKNKKLEYDNDKFALILPNNASEIISEGINLQHCVGTYCDAVASGRTIIMFLRRKEEMNKSYFTMEVYDNTIRQFFGYHDTYNNDKDITAFVKEFAKEKKLEIGCRV